MTVKIKIDGKEYEVGRDQTVLEAATGVGVDIPHFCYHKGLVPDGNCRMCLVKVGNARKPVASCITSVVDGMDVTTCDEEIARLRQGVLELILANHPLDCPICDKAGECMLQDNYFNYSGKPGRFQESKNRKPKKFLFSDRIIYDAERCILCTRCVRFTEQISKSHQLGIINRGDKSYVSLVEDTTFDDPYSECTVDLCPGGALTSRKFRFTSRVWYLERRTTVCALCARVCSIYAHVRDGRIFRTVAREDPDINRYWMCDRGRDLDAFVHRPRTRHPMIEGERAHWEDAINHIHSHLKAFAPDEIGVLLSSFCSNEEYEGVGEILRGFAEEKNIFYKEDRHKDPGEVESDNFLICADKNPNRKGFEKYFKPRSFDAGAKPKCLMVVGGGFDFAELVEKGTFVIWITPFKDEQQCKKANVVLPSLHYMEYDGTFTNVDGIENRFYQVFDPQSTVGEARGFMHILKQIRG